MTYRISFTTNALKTLKKLDKNQAKIILNWLEKNIDGTNNPRLHGKGLTADKSGLWRYRIGKYRVLTTIKDNELIIEVIKIGLRGVVYKK